MAKFLKDIDTGDVSPQNLIIDATRRGIVVCDLETTGLDPLADRIEGVAFYVPPEESKNPGPGLRAWYPFVPDTFQLYVQPDETPEETQARLQFENNPTPDNKAAYDQVRQEPKIQSLRPALDRRDTIEALRPLFEDYPQLTIVGANFGKFDRTFLYYASGGDRPIDIKARIGDSLLLDFLGDENAHAYGLKQRVEEFFGHKMVTYDEAIALRRQSVLPFMSDVIQPLGSYAMEDCFWTWRTWQHCLDRLGKLDPTGQLEKVFWGIDCKIAPILGDMEATGCFIDWRWLCKVRKDIEFEMDTILARIEARVGGPFNPTAAQQVSDLFFGPKSSGGLGLSTTAVSRGKNGYFSTGSKEIGHLRRADPLVADVLDWRSYSTVNTSFAIKLAELAKVAPSGRVRTSFNQTRTKIHRLSSSDPINFQNQPRDRNLIRKAFCGHLEDDWTALDKIVDPVEQQEARDSTLFLLGADYGQVELRVMCHLSEDPAMMEVYNSVGGCKINSGAPCARYQHWYCDDCNKAKRVSVYLPSAPDDGKKCPQCGSKAIKHQKRCRHVDLHQRTAEDVGVERDPLAKNLNFGVCFRIGGERFCQYADLYDSKGEPRVEYAQALIDGWMNTYAGVPGYHARAEKMLRANRWVAYTLSGRQRHLLNERYVNEHRAITQAIQFAVSGTAQDIIKIAMFKIIAEIRQKIDQASPAAKKLWRQFKLLVQIHDELLFQVPWGIRHEAKELVDRNMVGAACLKVPLEASAKIGRDWDSVH